MYYSIQPTQDKGQIGSTRQVAVPCRSAGDLYQALADSNKQALTDHHATYSQSLMSLTACKKYKPLGVALTSLMSALYPKLPRETAATEQQRPASQLPILQYRSIHVLKVIISMHNCQSMASTGNKFVSYTPACAISDLQAPRPRAYSPRARCL